MGDISEINASQAVKIIGSGPDGSESNPVEASSNNELYNADCVNHAAIDIVLSLTTTPQEVKVGASRQVNRKYLWMQALDANVKWGFDTNCRFDLFKNQMIIHPVGNVPVYMKVSTGTGSAAVGEGA